MLTITGFILPGPAAAHTGLHEAASPATSLWHLLTEPDHLALAAVGLVACALVWRRVRGRG